MGEIGDALEDAEQVLVPEASEDLHVAARRHTDELSACDWPRVRRVPSSGDAAATGSGYRPGPPGRRERSGRFRERGGQHVTRNNPRRVAGWTSWLCAMRITGQGIWDPPRDESAAIALLRRVVDRGVTFIDTADSYGPGISETLIAKAL